MNRRSEHFFGDMLRHTNEDEYINMTIIPAKPRTKPEPQGNPLTRAEQRQLLRELRSEYGGM